MILMCTEGHGPFRSEGIDQLQRRDPATFSRGPIGARRFACPVCCSVGKPGWTRPATTAEAASLTETTALAAE